MLGMRGKDVLSPERYSSYIQLWDNFAGKEKLETPFNVHSSFPVISQVMVYPNGDHPVFRTRVFQGILRKFDPYFVTTKYANPFWHVQHYLMSGEQMFHASMGKIRDSPKEVTKDTFNHFNMKLPTFWDDSVNIELVLKKLDIQRPDLLYADESHFTFLNGRNLPIATFIFNTYTMTRSYVKDVNSIKNAKTEVERSDAVERLKRKIAMQEVKHKNWHVGKRNLDVTKDELFVALNNRDIPEEALYEYFSLWDIPKQKKKRSNGHIKRSDLELQLDH